MTRPVKSSAILSVPRKRTRGRGPRVMPLRRQDRRSVPKPTSGRRRFAEIDTLERPVEPAEVAQARLFEGILQAEFAELHHLAYRTAGPRHRELDLNSHERSRDLLRIHACIDEVQHLLRALQGRYPHLPIGR
jgi:hypothetical protein